MLRTAENNGDNEAYDAIAKERDGKRSCILNLIGRQMDLTSLFLIWHFKQPASRVVMIGTKYELQRITPRALVPF